MLNKQLLNKYRFLYQVVMYAVLSLFCTFVALPKFYLFTNVKVKFRNKQVFGVILALSQQTHGVASTSIRRL